MRSTKCGISSVHSARTYLENALEGQTKWPKKAYGMEYHCWDGVEPCNQGSVDARQFVNLFRRTCCVLGGTQPGEATIGGFGV